MAKKKKQPLERWTPPAESFANAQKTEGNSGVTYSYEKREEKPSKGAELLRNASKALKGFGENVRRTASTEAEMTFGKPYDPKASDSGRVENTLLSGGKGWTAGQANALAFLLDPTDDGSATDAEMMFGTRSAGKAMEGKAADWLNRQRGKASEALYGAAGKLNEEAAESEAEAKKGLGKIGRLLVDVGIAGLQLAADATIGRLTGAGMTTMGTRTFGQSAREALDSGATQQQAFNYAASSAAVEMLTEKMFDVGKIFGKGAGDELIEKAVEKWAKSNAGRSALRTFFGVLTESGEEAASGLVNPMIRLFIDSDAVKDTYGTAEGRRQLASDIGHDAMIGGVLGGLGTVATGQNRAANAQIRANEAARAQEAENARRAAYEEQTARERALFASNAMQTGAADAEVAEILRRNAELRGETAQEAENSPVSNPDVSDGSLTENEETAATRAANGQIQQEAPAAERNRGDSALVVDRLKRNIPSIEGTQTVNTVSTDDLLNTTGRTMADKARTMFEQIKGVVSRSGFGNVEITNRSVKDDLSHGVGAAKASVIPAIPAVIQQGQQIDYQKNWKGRAYDGYVFAAPVEMDGRRVYVAAVVLQTSKNRFYLHEVVDSDGNIIKIDDAPEANPTSLATVGDAGTSDASSEISIPNSPPKVKTDAEIMLEAVGVRTFADLDAARQAETATMERTESGLPEGQGAMSPAFPYQEAPSQTNSADGIFTDEERQNIEGLRPEDLQHQVRTNADVDYHAQERLESDYEGEKADLFRDEREWDVVDIATAWQILTQETRTARETGDWSEVVRLRKSYRDKASNWGQVGHEMSRHAHTAEDIISDAAEQLDEIGDVPPDEFNDIMRQVDEFASEWENMEQGDGEAALDLICRLNAARRTGGLFTPERTGNTLNRTLEAVVQQEGGFNYLRQIAEQQIRNLANDRAPLSPVEAAKSIRYMSMLSKLTPVMRNLVGNNVFDPIESLSGNVATLPDMLMSLVTHRRTTAADASWFSEAKRRGSVEAMQRAYIAAALDADTTGDMNRWEQRNGRTFKMAGNPVSRFLSTMEKWQQYALTVTDEFQKGGIEAEAERQRQRLIDRGRLEEGELEGWAEETARQRTFQNEGRVSKLMLGARNLLNDIGTINDGRGGSFGVGDALIPFARVPGNVVGQFLNYTPAGAIRGMGEMVNVLLNARSGNITAEQQAQAARDIGRGLNGTALLTGFAALAARDLLNVADGGDTDDEKDLAKLQQSEGVTGTQWNLSATKRWLSGGSAEWQDGDDLMSIGFLEPINGIMALAALVAESDERNVKTLGNATAQAAMQAVADLPAMSSLTSIINNYKYAEGGTGEKLGMAGAQLVGDTVSSFVPNALGGIAQGVDQGVVRQTYGSDRNGLAGVAEETLNSIKGKVPGLRSQLPAALDNWGRERKTTASPFQNWLNSNLLPGAVTQYSTNRVNQELERLAAKGDVNIPNRNAEKSVTVGEDGEKKKLTVKEQRTYQQTYGRQAFSGVQALIQSSQYREMKDSERSAAINAMLEFSTSQARQRVGGSAETPSWAGKLDGNVAENAGLYALLSAAKQTIPKDDRGKIAEQLAALNNRGLSEGTTERAMEMLLDEKQLQKVQTLVDNDYSIEDIAAFWGAKNVLKKKADTLAWAAENGFTPAQAAYLWRVFENGA